ncbi:unnamed protein product [Larinioides sclopetarius]|uniref:B30.2/SPRY domain-containing protein n=1 Tax=Larinioides sclopetarius TaxID=280406 RepID=A0AAV1YRB5_9ARAC
MKIETEEIDETIVTLDTYNSDLNLVIDGSLYSAHPLTNEGFAFMWAGARATHGASKGKFCFEVKILDHIDASHLPADEPNPHVVRVGFSVESSSLQLGEDPLSYGYGGTGKISTNCQFKDFGQSFMCGDIILAVCNMDADQIQLGFAKNGKFLGWAYKINKSELKGQALFPHVLTKNTAFEVNFGQKEKPYFPLPDAVKEYVFIGCLPLEQRESGTRPPKRREDCEMIMMCGLPGAGKSVWAADYSLKHPEKKYNVLGTNNIIDKMKVMGLPRKRNYAGRWDVLIQMATKCLNKMFEIGSKLRRNYILDQTNVYPTAQRRKMRNFEGFKRIAVVVVPTEAEYRRRCDKRDREEGKEVPDQAVLEMKANFKLPEVSDIFDDVIYTDLSREEAEKLVAQYNEEGRAAVGPPRKQFKPNDQQSGYGNNRGFDSGRGNMGMRGGYSPRGGFDSGRGGFDSGRGGYDTGRGGFRGGRGGFNNNRGSYDSGRGGYEGGRGGYDVSRGGYEGGRGGYEGSRGGYEGGRGGFEGGRGGYDGGRGGFNGGYESNRASFEGGRGGYGGNRGGYDGGRGGYNSNRGGRGGYDGKRGLDEGPQRFDRSQGAGNSPGYGGNTQSNYGGYGESSPSYGNNSRGFGSRGSGRGRGDFGRSSSNQDNYGSRDYGYGSDNSGSYSGSSYGQEPALGAYDKGGSASGRGFRGASRDMPRGGAPRGGNANSRGSSRGGYGSGSNSGGSYGSSDYNRDSSNSYSSGYGSYQDSSSGYRAGTDSYSRRDTSTYGAGSQGAFKKEPGTETAPVRGTRAGGKATRWSAEITPASSFPDRTTQDTSSYSNYEAQIKTEPPASSVGVSRYDSYPDNTTSSYSTYIPPNQSNQGFQGSSQSYGYQSGATTNTPSQQWSGTQSSTGSTQVSQPTPDQQQWSQYYQQQSQPSQYYNQYYGQPATGTAPAYGNVYGAK